MRFAVLMLCVGLLLSGCLGIEKTTDEAHRLGDKLDDTKVAQQCGAALELMSNKENSTNIRAAASETVFLKCAEDRIGKYAGMPAPIKMQSFSVSIQGRSMDMKNVAYVSDKPVPGLDIAPINEDLYNLQVLSTLNLLKQMYAKSKMPGLSGDEIAELRSAMDRMMYIATAVQGAITLKSLVEGMAGVAPTPPTEAEVKRRETTASLLKELAKNLSLSEEDLGILNNLIATRLKK